MAREFWNRFVKLRTEQGDALFRLANRAEAAKEFALAFDLVRETCRENPEHAQARSILGYVRSSGGWALPDTARRIAAGQIYDEKFGWLPAERAEHTSKAGDTRTTSGLLRKKMNGSTRQSPPAGESTASTTQ